MSDQTESEGQTVKQVISACDLRPEIRVEIIFRDGREFIDIVSDDGRDEDRFRVPFYALNGLIAALSVARETDEPEGGS